MEKKSDLSWSKIHEEKGSQAGFSQIPAAVRLRKRKK